MVILPAGLVHRQQNLLIRDFFNAIHVRLSAFIVYHHNEAVEIIWRFRSWEYMTLKENCTPFWMLKVCRLWHWNCVFLPFCLRLASLFPLPLWVTFPLWCKCSLHHCKSTCDLLLCITRKQYRKRKYLWSCRGLNVLIRAFNYIWGFVCWPKACRNTTKKMAKYTSVLTGELISLTNHGIQIN